MAQDRRPAHVVILTGAGVSADSGLATFRDAGGLWEGQRPEDVATPAAWRRERALVWRFYQQRRAALASGRPAGTGGPGGLARAEPNAAHRALAAFEARCREAGLGVFLVTQNVDDLHERAGSRALHMHGELALLACEACGARVRDLEHLDPERFVPCGRCGHAALRPDVVWFGEVPHGLDEIARHLARATHFLALGTSGAVYPAAGFLAEARARGARTVVASLDAPDNLDPRDRFLAGRAVETVPRLLAELALELGLGGPA